MSSTNGHRSPPSVAIVGAGFGGIGMGIRLKQAGIRDFKIFERGGTVGGVWRANSYPGAACDVPSHLYSFSFAPGHHWSRRYAPRDEIVAYLEDCTRDYGLEPNLRLNTEVAAASFDADSGRWTVTTAGGESEEFDLLVAACGQLKNPAIPSLPGLDDFAGKAFHSAEWDHDHDLTGRRVAVIGTGASAIQFVPEIAPIVEKLTVYQRSAPWVIPKPDRSYPRWERRLFRRFPSRVAASRLGNFAFFEVATYGFTGQDWMMRPFRAAGEHARRRALSDPRKLEAATPDHSIGCKRILFSSDWYPAIARGNVELVADEIASIKSGAVVTADGVEREADTIIFGTGFRSHEFVAPIEIQGLEKTLEEAWAEAPEAYLGTTVSGFPNMFILYGPNTNHGSGSVPYTLQCQFSYVLDAVSKLRDGGLRYLDLRPETQADWRQEMDRRSRRTVWVTGGCHNWYLDESGRNTNNWPGPWLEFRRRTRRIDLSDYRTVA